MSKPRWKWLSKSALLAIHEEHLAEHGGIGGLRDEALLESALARPRNLVACGKPGIFELAASYGFGIVRNHPFLDGNKRTEFLACAIFLHINGYALDAEEADAARAFLDLADGKLSEKALALWLSANSAKS